jgi:predicted dehydrogenase
MILRIGLVGLGVISKFYLAALDRLENPVLAAICDLHEAKLERYRRRGASLPPPFACYTDYRDLLGRADIDAIVINVPNDQHVRICKDALLADKHVCCEKPLATCLKDAQELVDLSQQTGKTLFTAFHRRYNSNVQEALKQLPRANTVAHVTANYLERIEDHAGDDRWYLQPERCGGGCVADNGPNVYDTLSSFLGRLSVVSATLDLDEHGVDRRARVDLTTSARVPVRVHLDWAYDFGEKKDVTIHLTNGQQIYADMLGGFAGFKTSLFHEYEAVLTDFVRVVIAGGRHGEDGLDAVRLVEETYRQAGERGIYPIGGAYQ